MKLAVVGLGLIGGSIALDLKAAGFVKEVMGVDDNAAHQEQARILNLVDRITDLKTACAEADIIVLAVPVNHISILLPPVLDSISDHATVTDVGSTKLKIAESVKKHTKRKRFVASHPMAGTEHSGPSAAHVGLFKGRAAVICDADESDPDCVKIIEALYGALQMRLISMKSAEHDLHAAYVSHLSHISSFVLANTVLDKEKDADAIFNLASGGFESTVRLAKSSPSMWAPIFEQNQTYIPEALGAYIDRLKLFHESLTAQNFNQTKKYMEQSNEIKRVLSELGNAGGKNAKK